jgi:GNAT superfamily N-acetyltransferase
MSTPLKVECLTEIPESGRFAPLRADGAHRVRCMLASDPIGSAYMLGDLDPMHASSCTWWLANDGDRDVAAVLVYTGLSAPALLTHGTTDGIIAILSRFSNDLPPRAHVHFLPEHIDALQVHFDVDRLRSMARMGARAPELRLDGHSLPDPSAYHPIERLGHRDTGDIMEIYASYPDSFFEPHQLSTGHYYGVRTRDGHLAAVAGVHIASRIERLAVLGNIVTLPEHRGRGLSTHVTAHLCRALVTDGAEHLALNVERQNQSAMRVYEKLGFRANCTYLEGFVVRSLGRALHGRAP